MRVRTQDFGAVTTVEAANPMIWVGAFGVALAAYFLLWRTA